MSYEFVARFLGSHDDTDLAIRLSIDGKPLTCAEGSTTESRFEQPADGAVTLNCRFTNRDAAQLEVALRVHHAQLESTQLRSR